MDKARMWCVCVCGDFTLHFPPRSDHTHFSNGYFTEPVTTLSAICQEADSLIITIHIKQKLADAVDRCATVTLSAY